MIYKFSILSPDCYLNRSNHPTGGGDDDDVSRIYPCASSLSCASFLCDRAFLSCSWWFRRLQSNQPKLGHNLRYLHVYNGIRTTQPRRTCVCWSSFNPISILVKIGACDVLITFSSVPNVRNMLANTCSKRWVDAYLCSQGANIHARGGKRSVLYCIVLYLYCITQVNSNSCFCVLHYDDVLQRGETALRTLSSRFFLQRWHLDKPKVSEPHGWLSSPSRDRHVSDTCRNGYGWIQLPFCVRNCFPLRTWRTIENKKKYQAKRGAPGRSFQPNTSNPIYDHAHLQRAVSLPHRLL